MQSVTIPKINGAELKIILLLDREAMHVRALRAEMGDYGSISRYLQHLERLGYIRRERTRGRVLNILTRRGRRLARALQVLKA